MTTENQPLPAAAARPQPCEYTYGENGDIVLPDGPPFDGHDTQDGTDYEGFQWVYLDDKFTAELDDAKFWMPLPNTPASLAEGAGQRAAGGKTE